MDRNKKKQLTFFVISLSPRISLLAGAVACVKILSELQDSSWNTSSTRLPMIFSSRRKFSRWEMSHRNLISTDEIFGIQRSMSIFQSTHLSFLYRNLCSKRKAGNR